MDRPSAVGVVIRLCQSPCIRLASADFPDRVEEWMGELSKSAPVVAFCVYGFHVGCQTVATLRKAGFDARYMAGGHFAWKAIKGPVKLSNRRRPRALE
jgi:rhodanese-related sulfurtransferase